MAGFRSSRTLITCLSVLFLLGCGSLIQAQTEKAPVENCGDLPTQSEMNDCAAREAKKADAALNATYRELLQKIKEDKTATEKVVIAEKAWIAFRDAELAAALDACRGSTP